MTYEQVLEYIHTRTKYGSRLGLHRMEKILSLMGNPQKDLKFIHIAGTNGKGSTTAMTTEILKSAGYKVGMYVSPFVVDFRERMQINGQMIEKQTLADCLEDIMPFLLDMEEADTPITEFELDTTLAIKWFAENKCDFVAFEVGLGGRFDATNVIDAPVVAAICKIAYDHMAILGDTITKIAFEKCGIIKRGSYVASYPMQEPDALDMITQTCKTLETPLKICDESKLENVLLSDHGATYTYDGEDYEIGLVGEHQVQNSLTVLAIIEQLNAQGVKISLADIKKGLKNAKFGGRLETVANSPTCIIDGAHNPDGVEFLCRTLDSVYAGKRLITVMGILSDKEWQGCVAELAKRSDVFIATLPDTPRAAAVGDVAAVANESCREVHSIENAKEAAKFAKSIAHNGDVVLACGSLYMIGDAKRGFTE